LAEASEFEIARSAAEERALVESAAGGSKGAFERLYRLHVNKVYGLCLRMTADRSLAEDCTQDAFVQAWRALPSFERRSSFGTWIHRIAVNAVLAHGRKRSELLGEDESVDETVAGTLADRSASDPGLGRDLEQAIGRLPAGARQVLVLCGIYGYSHEEAASTLQIAVGTCKAQLHRARKLLAANLGSEEAVQ
jgi:RNA polymerase sigma-70 factor (ECF subfamily)